MMMMIPEATFLPPMQTLSIDMFSSALIFIFDLETTSLYDNCDLIQISGVRFDQPSTFNQYILP